MFPKFACGFTVVIPLLLTLQSNNITIRALADKTQTCGDGRYNDGGVCKECPAGFFGTNCSAECPALYYGIGCLQNCDCSPCHHVYGCVSSTLITETTSHGYVNKDEIKDTTEKPESISCKNENKDNIKCKDQMQKPEHKTNFDRNVVIFAGSALSFILILAILREICLVCRFPRPTGLLSTSSDVYTDIAEVENRVTE
ncbi:uncharacterized protein LOC128160192 isoform X1 [Crassostrea angulata]|uniref:uncharacterized protein LOC128160192 isoform X1 n=1 Tax=Magallana angulata TaxID=2784310 RepID=UPI0022B15452|nr:uncharacterized protein LOC128160192 isoform X1 [Crassostrea angulata]